MPLRSKFHLKAGDVLEFDENAPFLKATREIPKEAWEQFGQEARDLWAGMDMSQVMKELRGPVELPPTER